MEKKEQNAKNEDLQKNPEKDTEAGNKKDSEQVKKNSQGRLEKDSPDEKSGREKEEKRSSPDQVKKDASAEEKPAKKKPSVKPKKKEKKSPVIRPRESYLVTSSPHIFGKDTVSKIMWTVTACLALPGIFSIYIFGIRAFFIIALGIIGAVGAEFVWQKLNHKKVTIADGSAFLTGLLLAFNLPPTSEWWMPLVGSAFAIIIVKQFFGGLGMNIFNPALAARGFLVASWPQQMSTWAKPVRDFFAVDLVTKATPLDLIKRSAENPQLLDEFRESFPNGMVMLKEFLLGFRGGCVGETCALLLILGGLYLIWKKYIDWQIPVTYIATVGVFAIIFGREPFNGQVLPTLIFHIFSGGLILGAFFMATDYVTTPSTVKGRVIFALGCGILTGVIRMWGGFPEGVCYSILIMNGFVPIIDNKTRPRVYGTSLKESKPE